MRIVLRKKIDIIEINGQLRQIVKEIPYTILEEGLSHHNLLKKGFEPDQIALTQDGEVVLLRDQDLNTDFLTKSELIKRKNQLSKRWTDVGDYYEMIISKIQSYERELKLEKLLNEPIQESEDIWI